MISADPGSTPLALKLLSEAENVRDIPEFLRRHWASQDCVIWKPSKRLKWGKPLIEPVEQWRLYPWTSTFASQQAVHSGLPLEFKNDSTGRTYLQYWSNDFKPIAKSCRVHNDFLSEDGNSISETFIKERGLTKLAVAFFFLRPESAPYAVTLYRNDDQSDFREEELADLDQCATCIPYLIDRFANDTLRSLLIDVQQSLVPPKNVLESKLDPQLLTPLCRCISTALHCEEATIILAKAPASPETYGVAGTSLASEGVMTQEYTASKSQGLTGYVLKTGEVLHFHDLANFEDPVLGEKIKYDYDGIKWKDTASIQEHYRKTHPNIADGDKLPPITFLGVPIRDRRAKDPEEARVLGMIRCSAGKGPYFFIPAEVEVLELVAGSVGRWWSDVIRASSEAERANLLKGLIDVQNALQDAVKRSLEGNGTNPKASGRNLTPTPVITSAADEIVGSFAGIKLVAFRRYSETSNSFTCEEFAAAESFTANAKQGDVVSETECQLSGELTKSTANDTRPIWIPRKKIVSEGSDFEKSLYDGLAGVYLARVESRGRLEGILDFGWDSDVTRSPQSIQIRRLVGSLARELSLHEEICSYQERLHLSVEHQFTMTSSVGHQIKTPLVQAIETCLRIYRPIQISKRRDDLTLSQTHALAKRVPILMPRVLGTLRKAQSVGRFMEIYGKLAREEPLELETSRHSISDLSQLCRDVFSNNVSSEGLATIGEELPELGLTGELKGVSFIDSREFSRSKPRPRLRYNQAATEQAIDAIIGNALKYGAIGTGIEMEGTIESECLRLDVINLADRSILLTQQDAEHCFEEGFRSGLTKGYLGSGLGLWLAKKLMEEQGGTLRAFPTDSHNKTVFSLRIPFTP